MKKRVFWWFLVVMAAFAAMVLFSWPLILKLSSYYQENSDWALNSWILWYSQQAVVSGKIFNLTNYFNASQFYPAPFSLAFSENLLVPSMMFLPLYQLSHNLVLATNIFIFLTFVISFSASFYFLDRIIKDRAAAFLGALFYSFNPYIAEHLLAGHLQLLNRYFLPLEFLFAWEYFKRPTKRNALLFILLFSANSFSGIYFQNFSLVALVILFLATLWFKHRKNWKIYFREIWKTIFVFIPFIGLIIYFEYPYLEFSSLESVKRGLTDNIKLSARLIDWLFSLPESRLYGGLVKMVAHFRGADLNQGYYFYPERVIFPTISGLLLAGIGLWVAGKNKFREFSVLLVATWLLTLGPEVYIYHGFSLTSPIYKVFYYLGFLAGTRVPARFVFIFYLPFTLFIAAGFNYIKRKFKLWPVFLVLVLFSWGIENRANFLWQGETRMLDSLKYYQQNNPSVLGLIRQKTTVHYPLSFDEGRYNAQYFSWASYNQEVLVNGYSGYAPQEWTEFVDQVKDPEDERALRKLRAVGVDLAIIHKDRNRNLNSELIVFQDEKLAIIDLNRLAKPEVCRGDPRLKIVQEGKGNFVLNNLEDCFFVAKYREKYLTLEGVSLKLPIVVAPGEGAILK